MFKTGYVYDERMCYHQNENDPEHPESPERITEIMKEIQMNSLDKVMTYIPSRQASYEEILKVHHEDYLNYLHNIMEFDKIDLIDEAENFNSIYFNKYSLQAAKLSAGSVIDLVDKVVTGELDNGLAIVRPPGHHAEYNYAMGFCLFNNVAIAAKVMIDKYQN